ncbi:hypothetical protein DYB25_002901 [Aphanomyces astaci]|uniref:Glutamine amidotransferase domain-containing protein n=1 Tax=Aphanomyces astaci TaxID=112090 RepID=A0A397B3N7_APHAT|nr:hypothetical protein DYB25_002901 [Aphanomyces astaci]RHY41127.1 hypothetical protein DYB34_005676 [Aphanomyces astaci]
MSVRGIASSANALRFLIVDGYSPEGRLELTKSGVSIASDLYKRMLSTSADGLPTSFDVLFPSDGPFDTPDLRNYDAVAWTGCSLTVLDSADIRVTRQLELAKQCYAHGVPQYGSCWAAQIAVVAAGGVVSKNPRGREMGLARKMTHRFVAEVEKLYEDPSRRDIAWRLGLDTDVMDENVRYTESRNFIKHLVVPYKLSKTLLE